MSNTPTRNPWKPDPRDQRIPVGPGDTVSMHRARIAALKLGWRRVVFVAQPQENRPNGLFARSAQHFGRDRFGLQQQLFCHVFHTPILCIGASGVYS